MAAAGDAEWREIVMHRLEQLDARFHKKLEALERLIHSIAAASIPASASASASPLPQLPPQPPPWHAPGPEGPRCSAPALGFMPSFPPTAPSWDLPALSSSSTAPLPLPLASPPPGGGGHSDGLHQADHRGRSLFAFQPSLFEHSSQPPPAAGPPPLPARLQRNSASMQQRPAAPHGRAERPSSRGNVNLRVTLSDVGRLAEERRHVHLTALHHPHRHSSQRLRSQTLGPGPPPPPTPTSPADRPRDGAEAAAAEGAGRQPRHTFHGVHFASERRGPGEGAGGGGGLHPHAAPLKVSQRGGGVLLEVPSTPGGGGAAPGSSGGGAAAGTSELWAAAAAAAAAGGEGEEGAGAPSPRPSLCLEVSSCPRLHAEGQLQRQQSLGCGGLELGLGQEQGQGQGPDPASKDLSKMSVLARLVYVARRKRQGAMEMQLPEHPEGFYPSDSFRGALDPGPSEPQQQPWWKVAARHTWAFIKELVWVVWEPDSPKRMCWDVIMLVTVMYLIIVTPYLIAFNISTVDITSPIAIIDITINSILLFDVLTNFRTAYPDSEGRVVVSRWRIAKHYVQGWFWIDISSSLPYDNIFNSNELALLKLLRLLRIIRFIHVLRVLAQRGRLRTHTPANIAQLIEVSLGRARFGLIKTLLLAVSILHWTACLFYYSASWNAFDEDTWVWVYDLGDASYIKRYIWSFYWAIVTMATVGYGDILPISLVEHLVAIMTIFVGTSLFAYVMGSMASYIAASDSVSAALTRRRALVDEFLAHRNIPSGLREKVRSYYNYTFSREVQDTEHVILEGLSRSLQLQLVAYLYRGVLDKVPLFHNKNPQFVACLVPLFKLEYYSPDDVVVRQGEVGHEMYFVIEGQLEVRVYLKDEQVRGRYAEPGGSAGRHSSDGSWHVPPLPAALQWWKRLLGKKGQARGPSSFEMGLDLSQEDHEKVGTLTSGDHFGWASCMLRRPRAATVVTLDYCEIYCLKRGQLEELVAQWPEMAEDLTTLVSGGNVDLEEAAWETRKQLGLPGMHELSESMHRAFHERPGTSPSSTSEGGTGPQRAGRSPRREGTSPMRPRTGRQGPPRRQGTGSTALLLGMDTAAGE